MENNKKKTTVDSIWQELTSIWPSLPKAQFMASKIEEPIPFMGSRKQISFRRHNPMEHSTGPAKSDMTMDDWTRPHD